MGTYNAFYVRKQAADEATRAAILNLYPRARIQEMLPDFIGAILSPDEYEPPEQRLAEMSAKLATDIIWVGYQSTAGSFVFHHWRSGTQLRALWYGCRDEGTWDRAEGQAEPWEAQYFWSEEDLESLLECAETDLERRKLEQLWKEKVIRKGQTEPIGGDREAAHAVLEHYKLFPNESEEAKAVAPVPPSTGVRVFKALVWVAVLCFLGFVMWRHSK